MARSRTIYSTILGIPESIKPRYEGGYKDLKDVLNYIGVMAKRSEVPYIGVIISPSKRKPYVLYELIGDEYYVPKNWRDSLYEDLETGEYFIISQIPENQAKKMSLADSWIAFQATGLTEGRISSFVIEANGRRNREKEILFHSGSFIELIKRVGINDALDALAENEKPIKIKPIKSVYRVRYDINDRIGSVCQLDVD